MNRIFNKEISITINQAMAIGLTMQFIGLLGTPYFFFAAMYDQYFIVGQSIFISEKNRCERASEDGSAHRYSSGRDTATIGSREQGFDQAHQ